ncbi:MAG: hypothetical protein GY841_02770 [FCB group bacterium]|nr:hypothetical protein [FCB group bacterium]
MARTDATEIGKIIDVDSGDDLDAFIDAANILVTDILGESGTATATLAVIETWLAAHFYAIYKPRASAEKAGSVSESFDYKIDLALNQTRYGQMALSLDTTGALARHNKKIIDGVSKTASVSWLGTSTEDL